MTEKNIYLKFVKHNFYAPIGSFNYEQYLPTFQNGKWSPGPWLPEIDRSGDIILCESGYHAINLRFLDQKSSDMINYFYSNNVWLVEPKPGCDRDISETKQSFRTIRFLKEIRNFAFKIKLLNIDFQNPDFQKHFIAKEDIEYYFPNRFFSRNSYHQKRNNLIPIIESDIQSMTIPYYSIYAEFNRIVFIISKNKSHFRNKIFIPLIMENKIPTITWN